MLHVRLDSKDLNRKLNNAVTYSYGFLKGTEIEQIVFNTKLGEFTVDALNRYIDSNALLDPQSLHHVYEWDQVGNENARLFKIKSKASKRVIHFYGEFLPSKSESQENSEPFVDKAYIMENAIGIEVEPRSSEVLAWDDESGETVFTANAVYIAHPGGYGVEGSFGKIVEEFFGGYFTNALLKPFIDDLSRADEYTASFRSGVKGGGSGTGVNAGRKYIRNAGLILE